MTAEAGWYPDPAQDAPDGQERYWDGSKWTQETRSDALADLPPPTPTAPTATPAESTVEAPTGLPDSIARDSGSGEPAGSIADVAAAVSSLSVVQRIRNSKPAMGAAGVLILALVAFGLRATGVIGDNRELVRGLFQLSDIDVENADFDDDDRWMRCEGSGGYSDISAGNPVRIENQDGKRIGAATPRNLDEDILQDLAELEVAGTATTGLRLSDELPDEDGLEDGVTLVEAVTNGMKGSVMVLSVFGTCVFYWEAMVEKAEVYNFDIGRRGDIDVDRDQLVEDGFLVTFSIG